MKSLLLTLVFCAISIAAVAQQPCLVSVANVAAPGCTVVPIDKQSTSTPTVPAIDSGKLIIISDAAALPLSTAGTAGFAAGWWAHIINDYTSPLVITPASGTIGGGSTLTLGVGEGVIIVSDGTNWQLTNQPISLVATTGTITPGALLAGACGSGTVAVAGSTTGMVATASPVTYPGDGSYWLAYVSAAGTVTVKVCAAVAETPGATAYNVRVIQ